jgi:hypothetical protein
MTTLKPIKSAINDYKLLSQLNLSTLQNLFHDIPKDPYIQEGYRYKSLSRCRLNGSQIEKQPHTPLFQNKMVNPVHGGRVRVYPEITNLHYAKEVILLFANTFRIDYSYEILVQAQRTKCTQEKIGITTPEGFHRDDIDFLAILCVNQYNILGSETQLLDSQGNIIFKQILSPGEILLINDSQVLHYTSPITLKNPDFNDYGFRDVLIISSAKGFVNQHPGGNN